MKYLKDHEDLALSDEDDNDNNSSSSNSNSNKPPPPPLDWMAAHFAKKQADARAEKLRQRNERRRIERAKLATLRDEERKIAMTGNNSSNVKRTRTVDDAGEQLLSDQDFLLNTFHENDDDSTTNVNVSSISAVSPLSSSTTMMSKAAAQAVEALLRGSTSSNAMTLDNNNNKQTLSNETATEEFQERKVNCCIFLLFVFKLIL